MPYTQLKKYIWRLRIVLLLTPSYTDQEYIKARDTFNSYKKRFHQRYIKLITKRSKQKYKKLKIQLIGFDGKIKKTYSGINPKTIFRDVDKMPMGYLRNKYGSKLKPLNLSLYEEYKPKSKTQNLGFKDKQKALYTIQKINNKSKSYQVRVIATMLGRAKSHPNQTSGMRDAIKVFEKWMKEYRRTKLQTIR